MSAVGEQRIRPGWLALRESADAMARATTLLEPLRARLPRGGELVIRDLGGGTGAMARWLAGRLDGPQRWVLHDRDPDLLELAVRNPPGGSADGAPVRIETRRAELDTLRADHLRDTALVTASALLDLLTRSQVDSLVASCVAAGRPALLTLSVVGLVELDPPDPLDGEIAAAFNEHQCRDTGAGRLLGADAVEVAAGAFESRGVPVRRHPSPWRLGPDRGELVAEWLRGWVGAAGQQRPALRTGKYLRDRLEACAAGELRVVVHHADLLALPEPPGGPA